MSLVLRLSLLVTVASCLGVPDEEDIANHDRLLVQCWDDRMEIHVKKDYDQFSLKGVEAECNSSFTSFTEYDGQNIRVKTWSLPLTEKTDGPCGLRFAPLKDSKLWAHSITVYGKDKKRTVQCLKTGVLDKRGARIRLEQVNPAIKELLPVYGSKETVEVPKRTTISAFFYHNFPQEAGLSLHPIQCWLVNERRGTRRQVVNAGCPLLNRANETIVSIGSESASAVTGDHPHVFFNAEPALFEDEDPSDLPSFRLQCTVIPCKGLPFHQQVVGVARCPSIAWCQEEKKKKMVYKPKDTFEINQEFSLSISSYSSISEDDYRPLGTAIYPGGYMALDAHARAHSSVEEVPVDWTSFLAIAIFVVGIVALLLFALYRIFGMPAIKEEIRQFVRRHLPNRDCKGDFYPAKKSTDPLVEDADVALQQRV